MSSARFDASSARRTSPNSGVGFGYEIESRDIPVTKIVGDDDQDIWSRAASGALLRIENSQHAGDGGNAACAGRDPQSVQSRSPLPTSAEPTLLSWRINHSNAVGFAIGHVQTTAAIDEDAVRARQRAATRDGFRPVAAVACSEHGRNDAG